MASSILWKSTTEPITYVYLLVIRCVFLVVARYPQLLCMSMSSQTRAVRKSIKKTAPSETAFFYMASSILWKSTA
jgi:hypothetical protein